MVQSHHLFWLFIFPNLPGRAVLAALTATAAVILAALTFTCAAPVTSVAAVIAPLCRFLAEVSLQ